jgi:cell division protein FtsQ
LGRFRPRLRLVIATVLGVCVLLAGAWIWLRDSSLVAVERVAVVGQSGPDAAAIRSALISAARGMTTLNVQMDQLRSAVSPFPAVKSLQVSTQFPHGMRIRVIERLPVAAIMLGGRAVAVAADGTLLHDVTATSALPMLPLAGPPGGPRLTKASGASAIRLLAAAPYQLLARISQVSTLAGHGLVAQVRGGPSIYFGDATDLRAKWISASGVLADPGSAGAAYIDVTDPVRPAAGSGSGSSASAGSTASTTAGAGPASGTTGG